MVMVKDLTQLTLRDLWREVKDEDDWLKLKGFEKLQRLGYHYLE